jgi:hypothetical protein
MHNTHPHRPSMKRIALLVAVTLALTPLATVALDSWAPATADAHALGACNKKKLANPYHPDVYAHVRVIVGHGEFYSYASESSQLVTYCGASSGGGGTGWAHDIVDLKIAIIAQKLVGSYSTCYSFTRSWQGNDKDPYTANATISSIRSSATCNWLPGGNSVRAVGHGWYQDSSGPIWELWGYTSAHAGY